MNHALVYHGKFATNHSRLTPETGTLIRGGDGAERPLPRTRASGIKFGYMDFAPRHDVVVKVDSVVLDIPVRLESRRHARGLTGAPSPRRIGDDAAGRLLGDVLRANPHLKTDLKRVCSDVGLSFPAIRSAAAVAITSVDIPDIDDLSKREGGRRLRTHLVIERDRTLVKWKKADVQTRTGRLVCEACDFDFAKRYPSLGSGFCEVHHREGLAARGNARNTPLADLAILCSNCHRMIHRTKPMLTVSAFRDLIHADV
jgi:hypothetical protein